MKASLLILVAVLASAARAAGPKVPRKATLDPNQYYGCHSYRGFIPEGATIQEAGFRLLRVNGEVMKNASMVAMRTVEAGHVMVKVWGPGYDPSDPFVISDMLHCLDPNPPAPRKPYYYLDTY